jgi:hypothetical protein
MAHPAYDGSMSGKPVRPGRVVGARWLRFEHTGLKFGNQGDRVMAILGSCHCRATQFEVTEAPETVTRCTCSFCSKRGSLWAYYTPGQFRLVSPESEVSTYRWGSRTIKHHFCAICGCGTFTETPDWSTGEPDFDHPKISINARLLDDFDLDAVPIRVIDGKNLW